MKKLLVFLLCGSLLLLSGCGFFGGGYDSDLYWDDLPTEDETVWEESFDYVSFSDALSEAIASYPAQGDGEYASCRLIVSGDAALVQSVVAERCFEGPGGTWILQFATPDDAIAAKEELMAGGGVQYAEPDILISGDDFYSWGASAMASDTFSTNMAAQQVMTPVIAVVDSGVNTHEMLGTVDTGWDFVDNDSSPTDAHGHGTHVAGTVSDIMGDFSHIILPVRVLNENNQGYASQGAAGIRYAADHGADIINLSFSGPHSSCREEAIRYALDKGCSVVVSAGNQAQDVYNRCPAHIENVVTVSAVDANYKIASFSNFGTGVDICAPGVDVLSANYTGGYVSKSGTSMAAPHISAVLGLILGSGAAETSTEAEAILLSCCTDLGDEGRDFLYGWGFPDMDKVASVIRENTVSSDYWILSIADNFVANIIFHPDGTAEFINESGTAAFGNYYTSGGQLTIEDSTYFYGKEFFYDTGSGYISDGSYPMSDGSYMNYILTHSSGVHTPLADDSDASSFSLGGITPIADGTYYVDFYPDSLRTSGADAALTVDFLGIIELSDSEVQALTPGTYHNGTFSLNVEYVNFSSYNGTDYVDINDWEYGQYIPDRDVWRFYTVDDQPLTYYASSGDVFIPASAVVWDYLTPFIYDQNAIGMVEGDFMTSDDSFYCTASIIDFCDWHAVMGTALYAEKAYITVSSGAVTTMTIPLHP